jgi:hypothetical protein
MVRVSLFLPGSFRFLLENEPGIGDPLSNLLHAWVVVVVAVGSVEDDLALYDRKA